MDVLALDIGGANLKLASSAGAMRSEPFEVWRRPQELAGSLADLIAPYPRDLVAVTMTAELCDCFETKAAGVHAILDAVEWAAAQHGHAAPIRVWLSDGRLVAPAEARGQPLAAAAANWVALATWAGRFCHAGPALLIDIGSTTSDIIPLLDGRAVPAGRTDLDRLARGELVYSGVRRTPVCAVLNRLRLGDRSVRVAAEWFATMEDVYVWRGELPERPDSAGTADARPALRTWARDRLARLVCADRTQLDDSAIGSIAEQAARAQLDLLVAARSEVEARLPRAADHVIVAGSGEFLARRVVSGADRVTSLAEQLGPAASHAACAYALAVLAAERYA
jgi:hypothetical protein